MIPVNTNYTLSITSQNPVDNSNSSITINSNFPEDLVRLLQLSGQTNDCTSDVAQPQQQPIQQMSMDNNSYFNATPVDTNDLINMSATKPCGCNYDCDCDCESQQDYAMMEEQAEYDYGDRESDSDAHEFDLKDYNFKGRADLPERLTSARYGSNPIRSEMKEHKSFSHLMKLYEQFLAETDANSGQASPLTADNRNEFLHDPLSDETPVTDGSRSPLSRIKLDPMLD
jgi:hypothetical protein